MWLSAIRSSFHLKKNPVDAMKTYLDVEPIKKKEDAENFEFNQKLDWNPSNKDFRSDLRPECVPNSKKNINIDSFYMYNEPGQSKCKEGDKEFCVKQKFIKIKDENIESIPKSYYGDCKRVIDFIIVNSVFDDDKEIDYDDHIKKCGIMTYQSKCQSNGQQRFCIKEADIKLSIYNPSKYEKMKTQFPDKTIEEITTWKKDKYDNIISEHKDKKGRQQIYAYKYEHNKEHNSMILCKTHLQPDQFVSTERYLIIEFIKLEKDGTYVRFLYSAKNIGLKEHKIRRDEKGSMPPGLLWFRSPPENEKCKNAQARYTPSKENELRHEKVLYF